MPWASRYPVVPRGRWRETVAVAMHKLNVLCVLVWDGVFPESGAAGVQLLGLISFPDNNNRT